MSSDSEWNSFANLSRISDEDIKEEDQEDVEKSPPHKLTSCFIFGLHWQELHFVSLGKEIAPICSLNPGDFSKRTVWSTRL